MNKIKVSLVEDDAELRGTLEEFIKSAGGWRKIDLVQQGSAAHGNLGAQKFVAENSHLAEGCDR